MHDIQETIDANLEKGKGDNWRCAVDVDGRALKLQFIEALPMHARVRVTDRDQVVICRTLRSRQRINMSFLLPVVSWPAFQEREHFGSYVELGSTEQL